MDVNGYAPGTFCWLDLGTPDVKAAETFYQALFGWTTEDTGMGYTMCLQRGRDVGGIYEEISPGIPPHWNSYVRVENADAATARAAELGADLIVEPFDVHVHGRMAMIKDPTGAHLALWQPNNHKGCGIWGEHGAPCWIELQTRDSARAEAFYSALLGWQAHRGHEGYVVFTKDGAHAAGMLAITEAMGPIPPNWLPYFAVTDCDTTTRLATELGGSVLVPTMEIPRTCRLAVIQDPTGAVSGLMSML